MILLFRYDPSGTFAWGNATSVAMMFNANQIVVFTNYDEF